MELLVPQAFIANPQDVKKMFISDLNRRYVKSQIKYAVNTLSEKKINICQLDFVDDFFQDVFVSYQGNNILELHKLNKPFIINTAKLIIEEPKMVEFRGNGIDEHSFREGVWHPEDLFLQTPHNRNAAWKPFEVRFDPQNSKWKFRGGYIFNPNEIYHRHTDFIENNGEDRRVQIPRKINYF